MLRAALVSFLAFSALCGLLYPVALTGASQALFPSRADGEVRLIGRDFSDRPELFQSRPSVTEYAPNATFFNNRGPNQATLAVQLNRFKLDYAEREGIDPSDVPVDAATTSASGVDPHISPRNARIQARRVARLTGLAPARVRALIDEHTDGRGLGVFGEPGVNVRELNAAIEAAR